MVPLTARFAALAALLGAVGDSWVTLAAPTAAPDPCAKIAGKTFVPPADALACLKSFPFNETLRQNVLTVVDRVFDFYTFEDYYLNSPPPFQDSTVNIRAQLARINTTKYAVSIECLWGRAVARGWGANQIGGYRRTMTSTTTYTCLQIS